MWTSYLQAPTINNTTCILHNNTSFSHFTSAYCQQAQVLCHFFSISGVTIQEEAELTTHLPSIPPYGSAHYAFPAFNAHFPEISLLQDPPKLLLAGCDDSYESWTLHWSNPIDVTSEHDMFVNLPTTSDVKVHIEKVGHTVHVFIDPVSRAEVSAKEIISRLKGGKEKTIVVETKRKTSECFKTPPRSPTSGTQNNRTPFSPKSPQELLPLKKSKKERIVPSYVIECAAVCKVVILTLLDESSDSATVHELLRVSG